MDSMVTARCDKDFRKWAGIPRIFIVQQVQLAESGRKSTINAFFYISYTNLA